MNYSIKEGSRSLTGRWQWLEWDSCHHACIIAPPARPLAGFIIYLTRGMRSCRRRLIAFWSHLSLSHGKGFPCIPHACKRPPCKVLAVQCNACMFIRARELNEANVLRHQAEATYSHIHDGLNKSRYGSPQARHEKDRKARYRCTEAKTKLRNKTS